MDKFFKEMEQEEKTRKEREKHPSYVVKNMEGYVIGYFVNSYDADTVCSLYNSYLAEKEHSKINSQILNFWHYGKIKK